MMGSRMRPGADAFGRIGERWRRHGLLGIWRDGDGVIYIDDKNALGPLYFGLLADIEATGETPCIFRDMPEGREGLVPLWRA